MSEVRRKESQETVVGIQCRGKRQLRRLFLFDRNMPDGHLLAELT